MNIAAKPTGFFTQSLQDSDPVLFGSITDELRRQREEIELIAAENIASVAVMVTAGVACDATVTVSCLGPTCSSTTGGGGGGDAAS